MTTTQAPAHLLAAHGPGLRGAAARRRSRRLAALGAVLAATLCAGPALDVARAADGPPPVRPSARVHPERPASTVDLVRTAREPRPAQLGRA